MHPNSSLAAYFTVIGLGSVSKIFKIEVKLLNILFASSFLLWFKSEIICLISAGNRFDISSIEATPTNGYVYLRTSRYNVSGTSITFARSKYVTITSGTNPTVTESDSTTNNKFKITKVIGYSATK